MLITKKDPELPYWYESIGGHGKNINELFAISSKPGYPPNKYMRDQHREDDSDDSEDEYRRYHRSRFY